MNRQTTKLYIYPDWVPMMLSNGTSFVPKGKPVRNPEITE